LPGRAAAVQPRRRVEELARGYLAPLLAAEQRRGDGGHHDDGDEKHPRTPGWAASTRQD
jgi:hypothetical protein